MAAKYLTESWWFGFFDCVRRFMVTKICVLVEDCAE